TDQAGIHKRGSCFLNAPFQQYARQSRAFRRLMDSDARDRESRVRYQMPETVREGVVKAPNGSEPTKQVGKGVECRRRERAGGGQVAIFDEQNATRLEDSPHFL